MALSSAVLTVSDSCSAGLAVDKSGPTLEQFLAENSFTVSHKACVPDDITSIQQVIQEWTSVKKVDLIVTTGGTGLAARDVTYEAIVPLLDKKLDGIPTALYMANIPHTPLAMLSRLFSGVIGKTFIIGLPGSEKACRQSVPVLQPILKHAIQLVRGESVSHDRAQASSHSSSVN